MKKNYLIAYLVSIIIASVLLFPVAANSQDFTEAQKQERCQNNKNRITELEGQLKNINADLSKTMTNKEIEDARTKMVIVKRFYSAEVASTKLPENKWTELHKIAVQFNFTDPCRYQLSNERYSYEWANIV